MSDWRGTADRGVQARADWRNRLEQHGDRDEFLRRMAGDLPESFSLDGYIQSLIDEPQKVATRKALKWHWRRSTPICPTRSAAPI